MGVRRAGGRSQRTKPLLSQSSGLRAVVPRRVRSEAGGACSDQRDASLADRDRSVKNKARTNDRGSAQRLDGHGDARRYGSRSRNTAIARLLGLEGRCLPLSHIPNVDRVTPREAAASATLRLSLRRIARSRAGSGSPCSLRNSGLLARKDTRTPGTKKATGPRWNDQMRARSMVRSSNPHLRSAIWVPALVGMSGFGG